MISWKQRWTTVRDEPLWFTSTILCFKTLEHTGTRWWRQQYSVMLRNRVELVRWNPTRRTAPDSRSPQQTNVTRKKPNCVKSSHLICLTWSDAINLTERKNVKASIVNPAYCFHDLNFKQFWMCEIISCIIWILGLCASFALSEPQLGLTLDPVEANTVFELYICAESKLSTKSLTTPSTISKERIRQHIRRLSSNWVRQKCRLPLSSRS